MFYLLITINLVYYFKGVTYSYVLPQAKITIRKIMHNREIARQDDIIKAKEKVKFSGVFNVFKHGETIVVKWKLIARGVQCNEWRLSLSTTRSYRAFRKK